MAPTAVATRDRLLDEAEHLFARGGVQGVTTRQITEAAAQRNASAVTYHFGSRQGLLLEILARRGAPVDAERGRLRTLLGDAGAGHRPPVRDLVACLVKPYTDLLGSAEGRSYLRIVAQLRGRFAAWRVESDAATTRNLAAILDEIEHTAFSRGKRSSGSQIPPGNGGGPDAAALGRERVLALIILLTGSTAERARRMDGGEPLELDHRDYVENLVDLCTALVSA